VARLKSPDRDVMISDVGRLVNVESPSRDLDALRTSAHTLSELLVDRLGSAPIVIEGSNGPHVHWTGGGRPRVLIVGHH
jgi:glutamate carboxypeptidase